MRCREVCKVGNMKREGSKKEINDELGGGGEEEDTIMERGMYK